MSYPRFTLNEFFLLSGFVFWFWFAVWLSIILFRRWRRRPISFDRLYLCDKGGEHDWQCVGENGIYCSKCKIVGGCDFENIPIA